MIVGVTLKDQTDALENSVYGTSVIQLISPLVLLLSTPTERLKPGVSLASIGSEVGTIKVRPLSIAYPYNSKLENTEAHVIYESNDIARIRAHYLDKPTKEYVASSVIAFDPMRSRSSKSFFRSLVPLLQTLTIEFSVFGVDDPEHFIQQNYNTEAMPVLLDEFLLASKSGSVIDM